MSNKQIIDDGLYNLIMDLSDIKIITKDKIHKILIDEGFTSNAMIENLIESGRCPACHGYLINKLVGYDEVEYGGMSTRMAEYQRQCSDIDCGFVVEFE